jgi:hypothetical protein
MRTPILAPLVLLLGLAAACAPAGADDAELGASALEQTRLPDLRPELAQVNDVSILLPLAKNQGELDSYLTATSKGVEGELIPKAIYESAVGTYGTLQVGGTPAAPDRTKLRLVAIRFDPCFAAVGPSPDDAACENQMRLVFQTLKLERGGTVADDTAVHAFYAMDRADLKTAVEQVIRFRGAATSERLGALAPHPLIETEGLTGRTAKAINAIVLKYAGAKSLKRFTQFTTGGLGTAWNFSGFDVAPGGQATRMKIPHLPEGTAAVAFFAGFAAGELTGEPPFTPASLADPKDNMQVLGNAAWAGRVDVPKRQLAFDAAVRLENPTLHSPNTTDCASCHAAEGTRSMVGAKKLGLHVKDETNAFAADGHFVPKEDTHRTSVDTTMINLHMFSYKGGVASIHQRTINESAAVVAYLNEKVLDARKR